MISARLILLLRYLSLPRSLVSLIEFVGQLWVQAKHDIQLSPNAMVLDSLSTVILFIGQTLAHVPHPMQLSSIRMKFLIPRPVATPCTPPLGLGLVADLT